MNSDTVSSLIVAEAVAAIYVVSIMMLCVIDFITCIIIR